ncbi:hypothetical protein [Microcoleus sp. Pol17_C1]|uniref:hypothetical protein n=1 Tax=unclassified Microcoleus TaxID=2642155 RepID=UPI002FD4080E
MVSEPIDNGDRDSGNCSFSRQKPPRVWDWLPLSFGSAFLPKSGWELFSQGDGKWYVEIANLGYSYAEDEQQHSVAFYPLFPLLMSDFTTLGMEVELAGILINSWESLRALLVVASC